MWRSRARLRARRPGGRRVESPTRDRSAITSATRRLRGTPVHVRLFPPATPDRSLTPLLARSSHLLVKISQPRRAGRRGARRSVQHDARVLVHRQGRPAGHAALPVRRVRAADPRRVRGGASPHPRSPRITQDRIRATRFFIFSRLVRQCAAGRTSPRRILRGAVTRRRSPGKNVEPSRAEAIDDARRGDRRREGRRDTRREGRHETLCRSRLSPAPTPRSFARPLSIVGSIVPEDGTKQNKTKRRRDVAVDLSISPSPPA